MDLEAAAGKPTGDDWHSSPCPFITTHQASHPATHDLLTNRSREHLKPYKTSGLADSSSITPQKYLPMSKNGAMGKPRCGWGAVRRTRTGSGPVTRPLVTYLRQVSFTDIKTGDNADVLRKLVEPVWLVGRETDGCYIWLPNRPFGLVWSAHRLRLGHEPECWID